ncbi:MAG: RHS repeat-associated core domain-containing protein, partial [Bacteroidota bacterium]|nr:RHS repeat-associated core domain-containing protein [Bacteroidota bacterium]
MQMPGRTYSIAKTVGVPIIDHEFTSGNDINNWSAWGLTVSASGDDRLKAEGTGAWATAYASLSLEVGKRYRLTASIDLGSNLARVKYMVKNPSDGTFMFINNTKVDADIDVEFIATTTTADLIFQRADATSTNLLFYLDNVKVEEIGESYRYGFNGMEQDNEVKGNGNSLNFGARIYDSRLVRWLSVDPRYKDYPDQSPYNAFNNNPILFVDPTGESGKVSISKNEETGGTKITITTIVYIQDASDDLIDDLNSYVTENPIVGSSGNTDIEIQITYKPLSEFEAKHKTSTILSIPEYNILRLEDGRSVVDGGKGKGVDENGNYLQKVSNSGRLDKSRKGTRLFWEAFHETLHFLGLSDRYHKINSEPHSGWGRPTDKKGGASDAMACPECTNFNQTHFDNIADYFKNFEEGEHDLEYYIDRNKDGSLKGEAQNQETLQKTTKDDE